MGIEPQSTCKSWLVGLSKASPRELFSLDIEKTLSLSIGLLLLSWPGHRGREIDGRKEDRCARLNCRVLNRYLS